MRKQTDLAAMKQLARVFLMMDPEPTSFSPVIIKHPFTDSGIVTVRSGKDFTDAQIDTIEILLMKLYARFGIDDTTDYSQKKPEDFPILSDFYKLCEEEFMTYDKQRKYLYTEELLQEVCLGIHSMCVGAESKYFNGHTNITDDAFLCFGVKGLMDTNRRLKDAMLFNILSYMSNELLGKGNTMASIDELYLFLTNMTAIEYIRNAAKRARKKESGLLLASQNIEDFLIPSIKEFIRRYRSP